MSSGGRISRKVKQGKIEIDFEESALLVNYELEMVRICSLSIALFHPLITTLRFSLGPVR